MYIYWGSEKYSEKKGDSVETDFRGTTFFFLLKADFGYCQKKKYKEFAWKDPKFAFVIGGIPLVAGPLERGSTLVFSHVSLSISSDQNF